MNKWALLEKNILNYRWINILYRKVYETIYQQNWIELSDIKKEMQKLNTAYELVKLIFQEKYRDWWERYFIHLKETAYIVLNELPNPNLKKIVIAILHDIIEDSSIDKNILSKIFWYEIANSVHNISKKNIEEYLFHLDKEEIFEYLSLEENNNLNSTQLKKFNEIKNKIKIIRNNDYFWNLDNLDDDTLDVKFSDRIHNLRTIYPWSIEEIEKKLNETKKYFLHIAKIRNPKAYELLSIEIWKLHKYILEEKSKFFLKRVEELIKRKW